MGCIEHKQKGNKAGYGMAQWNGRMIGIHRKAYCVANGVEPDAIAGLDVRHKCDNPRCINVDHLELGTQADNMMDKVLRNRTNTAALTSEDVLFIRQNYKPYDREFGSVALASRFGVSQATISLAAAGKTYSTVTAAPAA